MRHGEQGRGNRPCLMLLGKRPFYWFAVIAPVEHTTNENGRYLRNKLV